MNDVNKEFRVARDQGKFVVSPHWLTAVSNWGLWILYND